MRRLAFLPSAFLSLVLCAASFCAAQSPAAYKSDPKFQNAIAEAKKLERTHQYGFAVDAYKKASKIAGGKDILCLNDLYNLQFKIANYKDAAQTASSMLAIAANPSDRSISESNRGLALLQQAGDKGKPELLQVAHESFQAAIADNAKNATAHFYDGKALARLNQLDAASEQFKACVSCLTPKDSSYVRAKHFAANPSLSLAKMAPAFEVTALDGSHFNLDEMGGRVVLVDFWATWCGPCNRELPHLKKIAQEFANEPFVIISVSWDSDETKWKDFIAKNGMTWVQYRDADHSLSNDFGINAIPHYFTIDSDGVLTAEMLGEGSNVEGKLKKLIAKAKADREKVQVATASSGD
jgi:thiol-disulfide isomerase/thioredoxin